MLCDVCKRCLEGIHDPTVTPRPRVLPEQVDRSGRALFEFEKYVFGHHRTHHSLLQSLEQQCLICVKFKDDGHDFTPGDDDYFTTFRLTVSATGLDVHMMCSATKVERVFFLVPLRARQESEEWDLEVDDNTGGQHAQKLIDKWNKNCRAKHLQCKQASESAFLPTRMLDFENVSSPATCRLVSREEVPPDSTYTTLSYCWGAAGKQGRICLLQSTFDTIRAGLPLTSLPKTYVDAIHVTARLGIRYIWIDALCIIQDSPSDWRSEASTMQAVYRNSYLTISAVAGVHDDSGLFYSRNPVKVQSTIVKIAYTSMDKPRSFLNLHENLAAEASWQVGNVTTKRGWCLQERMLPSRVLHFGAQQVFWECHEQRASETIPRYMWPDPGRNPERERKRVWKPLIGDVKSLNARSDPYDDLLSEWYDTLRNYSSCELTHASDKLVAISGLATDMKLALNTRRPGVHHTYLAGLWAEDLRFGLCWRVQGYGRRPPIYRSPSWSPMSLDGLTFWDWPPHKNDFIWHVGEMDCTAVTHYVDGLDTGEVTSGKLELRGPWMTIQTLATSTTHGPSNGRPVTHIQYIAPESELEKPLVVETEFIVSYDTKEDVVEQAFVIPIYTRLETGPRWYFRGIVLVPVEEGHLKCRRVGMIECSFHTEETAKTFFSQFEKRSVTVL